MTATVMPERPAARTGRDDNSIVRETHALVKDLTEAKPAIYWTDMLLSAGLGYGALFVAVRTSDPLTLAVAWTMSVLALYRAALFIHELTHIRGGAIPGFRLGWDLIVGVPLLLPSLMYDGVHQLHHAKTRYGTIEDPEYIPLAHRARWMIAVFVLEAALLPIAMWFRFAIGFPLSYLSPKLRDLLVARASALAINPAFRRRPPREDERRWWLFEEVACCVWAWTFAVLAFTGVISLHAVIVWGTIQVAIAIVNQIRTLGAHHWENEGEEMTIEEQLLDSVNVPGWFTLAPLWAPVGLRYHALHHLMPAVPYHNLAKAHRRLLAALPSQASYHETNFPGLPTVVKRLWDFPRPWERN
ncbi:MAG: fatty acid desaturase family protein [Gemmatimonadota bacterium]